LGYSIEYYNNNHFCSDEILLDHSFIYWMLFSSFNRMPIYKVYVIRELYHWYETRSTM